MFKDKQNTQLSAKGYVSRIFSTALLNRYDTISPLILCSTLVQVMAIIHYLKQCLVIINWFGVIHLWASSQTILGIPIDEMGLKNSFAKYLIWWIHQMETFATLLAHWAGNSPVTGEFPSQRPVAQIFDVLSYLRLKQLSIQSRHWWIETSSRSLWRYCNEIIRGLWLMYAYLSLPFIHIVLLSICSSIDNCCLLILHAYRYVHPSQPFHQPSSSVWANIVYQTLSKLTWSSIVIIYLQNITYTPYNGYLGLSLRALANEAIPHR